MVIHQEPDILECVVNWALGCIIMNKASGGNGIPAELFQILKDDAVKVLHSLSQQIWKTKKVLTGLEKFSFRSNPKERQCQRMFKLPYNCSQFTSIKLILKIPQTRHQQYMNRELPDVDTGFRKGRGTRDQIANICWII